MLNIVLGIVLIVGGFFVIFAKWLLFVDVFKMLLLLGLIAFGIIALLAGIKKLSTK